jgi:hypothetical protein
VGANERDLSSIHATASRAIIFPIFQPVTGNPRLSSDRLGLANDVPKVITMASYFCFIRHYLQLSRIAETVVILRPASAALLAVLRS